MARDSLSDFDDIADDDADTCPSCGGGDMETDKDTGMRYCTGCGSASMPDDDDLPDDINAAEDAGNNTDTTEDNASDTLDTGAGDSDSDDADFAGLDDLKNLSSSFAQAAYTTVSNNRPMVGYTLNIPGL